MFQQRLKIRGANQLVLHMSQDNHLTTPTVSNPHGHQFLPKSSKIESYHQSLSKVMKHMHRSSVVFWRGKEGAATSGNRI